MRKRVWHIAGPVLLAISVALVIWQGSFTFGEWAPTSIEETYLFWAISTLIFLLMVTLGFMLFRTGVKLYIERQANRGRTGLKTKMVIGALALSFVPVFFLVLFSISVLNRNLDKWFSRPAVNIRESLVEVSEAFAAQTRKRGEALAAWLAGRDDLRRFAAGGASSDQLAAVCAQEGLEELLVEWSDGRGGLVCEALTSPEAGGAILRVSRPISDADDAPVLVLSLRIPVDLADKQREIRTHIAEYDQFAANRKQTRMTYLLLLGLITLFILFVATWIALFLAKQINVPISALLAASDEVRRGNLGHRVKVQAIDELAILVQSFNDMTADLDQNSRELESRRRFIEAILENVPAGVISAASDGRIQTVNRALANIYPPQHLANATHIEQLFPADELSEIRYLLNRARRTGVASRQFDFTKENKPLHLSVTVSALEGRVNPGFVVVVEDTSDILRAQKTAAWREVARRIAHEMKNPLTPITLCAQRIARQVDKATRSGEPLGEDVARILQECSATISQEVESVRNLVDEFSQFARFPAAQPAPTDLNDVVEKALAVFAGRLDGIEIERKLASGLPQVDIDEEQFKRVVVNLVDNSAEAMSDSANKRLYVATRLAGSDAVELEVADSGKGISAEDKEKLFLPYFSTKSRGTGLGLAVVSQILSDHSAQIRVEDNYPSGARFIVEIPALTGVEASERALESRA